MSDTYDIIISDARWASENPILAIKRKPAPGALHVLTVGEVVPARLFFYDGPEGAASLSSVRKNGVTIGLFGKIIRKDGETLLFGTTVFTESQDPRGDYYYAGSLDLLTDELKNAFNQGFDGSAFVDIRINGVRTHQFKLPIRPRTYAGTELDTHPAAEGLLEEMQAAAAEADADAAAANAAKVAAEGYRNEAQGFRNEAEGFKNEAETARDESVAAKDISITKAGEAAGSATSAAGSATTATTKAGEASASASAAAASAASIVPAPPNSFAAPNERVGGDDLRLGVKGGASFTNGNSDLSTGISLGVEFTEIVVFKLNSTPTARGFITCGDDGGTVIGADGLAVDPDLSFGEWNKSNGNYSNHTAAGTLTVGKWYAAARTQSASGGYVKLFLDGVVVYGPNFNLSQYAKPFNCLGNNTAWGGRDAPLDVTIHSVQYYNRALTADEITACAKGEIPAYLAEKGQPFAPTNWLGASLSLSSVTATGFTADATGGGTIRYAYSNISLPHAKKTGQKVRIKCHVAVNSGSAAGLPGLTFQYAGGYVARATGILVPGDNVMEITFGYNQPAGLDFYFSHHDEVWGNGSTAVNYTVSAIEIVEIGTVEHFAADQVTLSGNLVGKFGGVLRSGSGVTPLFPVPSVTRVISGTVAGATLTAGAAPASIGAFTPSAGVDASAFASIGQWDAVSATWAQAQPANAGGITAVATTAGGISLTSFALGSNATVGASTAVKIVHTIN